MKKAALKHADWCNGIAYGGAENGGDEPCEGGCVETKVIDQALASRQILSMSKGMTNRTLKNGTILLEAKPAKGRAGGTIVLALIPWNLATPFVTWWMNDDGDTFGGDYVTTVAAGLKSFEGRSG